MKNTLLTLLGLFMLSSGALAQTEKGRWLVSTQIGNFTYQDQNGSQSFSGSLTPSAGYFVANGLVIGTGVPLSFGTSKTSSDFNPFEFRYSSTSVGLSPFVQYFIGAARLKPYLGVAYRYSRTHGNSRQRDTNGTTESVVKGHATAFTPTVGVAYFFTRTLALSTGLNYNRNYQESETTYTSTLPNGQGPYSSSGNSKTLSLNVSLLILVGK